MSNVLQDINVQPGQKKAISPSRTQESKKTLACWTFVSNNAAMRTQTQLHAELAEANVQEVSRISGVHSKTLYRIRQNPEYTTNARTAEAVSTALDKIAARRTVRATKAKAEA